MPFLNEFLLTELSQTFFNELCGCIFDTTLLIEDWAVCHDFDAMYCAA